MVGISDKATIEKLDKWLTEQLALAQIEASGGTLTYAQRKLVKENPAFDRLVEQMKELREAAGSDKKAFAESVATYKRESLEVMVAGTPPRGFVDTVVSFVQKKVSFTWDDDDIAGSIAKNISSFSFGNLFAGVKEGIKQTLLSGALEKFNLAPALKSLKSKAFAFFGKGEGMSPEEASAELQLQNGFAAFGDKLGIDAAQKTDFGNAMAQVIKRDMKTYDERQQPVVAAKDGEQPAAEPAKAPAKEQETAASKEATLEEVMATVKQLKAQLAEGQDIKAAVDTNKDGLVTNPEMLAFARSIIPETDGKVVNLTSEQLSTLVANLSNKDTETKPSGPNV
jgi:hypothetical protein